MTGSNPHDTISNQTQSLLIALAWFATLFVSTLPDALWDQFASTAPSWLFWAKAALLAAFILLGIAWKSIRPLRFYFLMLLVFTVAWRMFAYIRTSTTWPLWEENVSWTVGMLGIQFLKFGIAALTIVVLLLVMRRRQDAFLVRGRLDARAEPVRWLGMKGDAPWKSLAPIVAVIAAAIMAVVLAGANRPSAETLVRTLPLLPVVLIFSATNAWSEEVSDRASLLAPLRAVVGKGHAMAMTSVFFGLAHYAGGVPLAVLPTILMTAFLGWFMAKSMLETKGLFWPWFIHFIADIPVFAFLAIGSVGAGG
ncbi:MAG: CPBP family intramembrane metalloprotease [Chitinivibrionia bacterium]|nr:CPBP family intramembrane metalloprotease [Chitinivibrionia bacterium]